PENLTAPRGYDSGFGSSSGEILGSQRTGPGWGPTIVFNTGSGGTFDPAGDIPLPEYYGADLYINDELAAQLDLRLQEGVAE
ncbi:MAG: hypothetical protein IJX37_01215, partial [Oscillospiraceae bacterium]|nr:hypothetical protein [Oscillospiraceae bacterium]